MTNNLIKNGFIAAALMNICGVLLFSKAFSNTALNAADPVIMSNFGLLMIIVWGLERVLELFGTPSVPASCSGMAY